MKYDSSVLFRELTARIKTPELRQRVLAHVRIRSGHGDLPDLDAYHNNGATEAEKTSLYCECLKAVLTGNVDQLLTVPPVPPVPPVAVVSEGVAKAFGMDKLPGDVVEIVPDTPVTRLPLRVPLDPKSCQRALQFVAPVIRNGSKLPILHMIRCVTNGSTTLAATDLDNLLTATMSAGAFIAGECLLPKAGFMAAVKASKQSLVLFTQDQTKHLHAVEADGLKTTLLGLDPSEWPPICPDFDPSIRLCVNGSDLKQALKQVALAMSTDESRYVLNSVLFQVDPDKIILAGTDGRRLHTAEILRSAPDLEWQQRIDSAKAALDVAITAYAAAETGAIITAPENGVSKVERPENEALAPFAARDEAQFAYDVAKAAVHIIVPASAVGHILRLPLDKSNEPVIIKANKQASYAHIEQEPFSILFRQIAGNYPNYHQVIPNHEDKAPVGIDADLLARAVKHAATVCSEKSNSVKLSFQGNTCTVSGSSEKGEASSDFTCGWAARPPLSIAFNPRYLLDLCAAFKGTVVTATFDDELSPGMFKAGSSLAVIMPMRLS